MLQEVGKTVVSDIRRTAPICVREV
jgi:hypothetical protein